MAKSPLISNVFLPKRRFVPFSPAGINFNPTKRYKFSHSNVSLQSEYDQ